MGPEPSEDWEGWMKWDPIEDTLDSPRLPVQTSTTAERRPPSSKKRKSLSEDDDEDVRAPSSPGKARPSGTRKHNIVEKRYRTNINQRITALRDSIPSLRPVRGSKTQLVETEGSPTQKSNKATVLSTAVGYIQDLEKDKRRLENEIAQLKASLRAMKHADTIAAEHDKAPYVKPIAESSNQSQISTCSSTSSSESSKPVQGMIQVPEEMRRLRTSTTQIPFAQRSYIEHGESGTEAESTIRMGESSSRSAKFVGKLIVGSFAGLMVMQGFGESQTERKTVRKRSLLAVPAQQFWTKGRAILVQHTIEDGPPHFHVLSVLLKIYIVLVVCGFGIFLYAFLSKPKKRCINIGLSLPLRSLRRLKCAGMLG